MDVKKVAIVGNGVCSSVILTAEEGQNVMIVDDAEYMDF
jgi:hypothetical protein